MPIELPEYIKQIQEYIKAYMDENYQHIRDGSIEYRPNNGYGYFPGSRLLYDYIFTVHSIIFENFLDTRIPQIHSSPKALMSNIFGFHEFLTKSAEKFSALNSDSDNFVYSFANGLNYELINLFEHCITIYKSTVDVAEPIKPDSKQFTAVSGNDNNSASVIDTSPSNSIQADQPVKWSHQGVKVKNFYNKTDAAQEVSRISLNESNKPIQPSVSTIVSGVTLDSPNAIFPNLPKHDLRNVLRLYNHETLTLADYFTIFSTKHILAFLVVIFGLCIGLYNIGSTFSNNSKNVEFVEFHDSIRTYQSSIKIANRKLETLQNEVKLLKDSLNKIPRPNQNP